MKGIQLRQELMLDLLQMKEISTYRQQKNGTRIFQLPIKKYGQYIEVGSFKSGYVRRMNGCYTPYQLNKCENYDHFYKAYDYNGEVHKWTGKYNKHVCRRRLLIDNEYDRINYLITYCLKNYYINQANMIENGNFIPKWRYEHELKRGGHYDKVRELQSENNRLHNIYLKQTTEITEKNDEMECLNMEIDGLNSQLNNTNVVVNGEKYYRKR
jgi:hypothetical protein